MKKFAILTLACLAPLLSWAQMPSAKYENSLKLNPAIERFEVNESLGTPSFIQFGSAQLPDANNVETLLGELFQFEKNTDRLLPDVETHIKGGITVAKFKQVHKGVTVQHSAVIVNQKDGKIHSIASEVFDFSGLPEVASPLTEAAALGKALEFVNAEEYAWEGIQKDMETLRDNPAAVASLSELEEAQLPKGTLVYARDIYDTQAPRLAWRFNVYAINPLSRHYIYVDAENGKVLLADAIIKHADQVNASAQAAKAKAAAAHSEDCGHHDHAALFPAAPLTPVAPPLVSVPGTAQTRYAGTRDIQTTQLNVPLTGMTDPNNTAALLQYSGVDPRVPVINANVYVLKDETRGIAGGTATYDMNAVGGAPLSLPGLHDQSLAFVDKNNVWDNTAAGTQEDHLRGPSSNGSVGADEATNDDYAIDAHWGAEMVYDYWKIVHGRLSFDNKDTGIRSYTHYGPAYDNAFWNGSVMTYGDGSGTSATGFRPLTSLDVCGHEVGHGVCSFTSDLVYASESGAMNEALSDIWAACVENYVIGIMGNVGTPLAFQPFQIGEQIAANNFGLRRMDNPKALTDPDTYGGQYWQNPNCTPSLANDQCGVHGNSGVLNKWFYLLVNGPLATTGSPAYNDDGKADLGAVVNGGNIYAGLGTPIPAGEFLGIGFAKAEAITYLMELNLTPNATYAQARVAAINAAVLLYGACSQEEKSVTNAFFAINVGARYLGCSAPVLDAYAVLASIGEGVATTDCPRFNTFQFSANLTVAQPSATTISFAKTGGTLSNSEWAFSTGSTVTFDPGEAGVKSIFVKIFDDAMVEGNETLTFSATSALTSLNKTINLTIADNEVAPTVGGTVTLLNENFEGFTEGALPTSGTGWVEIAKTSPDNVQWAVRTDGALVTPIIFTTKRAIIERTDVLGVPGEAVYDDLTSAQTFLRSPQIVATGLSRLNVSFDYQASGEGACDPACDYAQLLYSTDGTTFQQMNAPPLFLTPNESSFDFPLPPHLDGETFYLGLMWYNDPNAGTLGSIAVDNFLVTGEGAVIVTALNSIKTEPFIGEMGKTSYFYDHSSGNIISSLKNTSTFDYGCMEAKVTREGTAAFTLFSVGNYEHKVAGKVVKMTPATDNPSGTYEISLYYTEAEIAQLEAATGQVRTNFSLYKVDAASHTQANSSNTVWVPATYMPVNGGGTFTAGFGTGFSSFVIGFPPAVPNLSPTVSVLPSNLVGTQAIGVVASLFEFNDNPSSGPITVYIPKDSKYSLSFSPSATSVSGVAVQNSQWSFDAASNPGFYILTSNSSIPASGLLKVGMTSSFNPNGQQGTTIVTLILLDESGGDSDNSDNQTQTVIVYTF